MVDMTLREYYQERTRRLNAAPRTCPVWQDAMATTAAHYEAQANRDGSLPSRAQVATTSQALDKSIAAMRDCGCQDCAASLF